MTDTTLRCPNKSCQKVLREGGVELEAVVFPANYEAVKTLLAGNIHRAKCPACETVVIFDPVACFLFLPALRAWLYVPPVVRSLPDVVDETLRAIRQALADVLPVRGGTDPGGRVELVDTVEELNRKARTVIGKFFVDLFQGFLLSSDQGREEEWLQQHISQLDANFFTAFQLVLDGYLAILFGVAQSTGDAQPTQADLLKELAETRTRLVARACLDSVLQFFQTQDQSQHFLETLEDRIPPCVLDERQVSNLAAIAASTLEGPHATVKVAYALEALVAWAAFRGGHSNPRTKYWAACVAAVEGHVAGGSEDFARLRVPDEFLKETLDYHDLWNTIALRLRDETLGDIRTRYAAAEPLFALAERLGMGDVIAELIPQMTRVRGLDGLKEEGFQVLVANLFRYIDEPGGISAYAQMITRVIHAGRFDLALEAIEEADARLVPAGRLADVSRLRCRAAQAFNDTHQHPTAERLLAGWIEHLKDSAEWEGLSLPSRLDMLNELGNVFRYAGKLSEAITLYTEGLDLCAGHSVRDERCILLKNLGIAYRDSGRLLDGIRYIQQSMEYEMAPVRRSTALHSLALCHDLLGDDRKAIQYLEEALKLLKVNDPETFARERMRLLISLAKSSNKTGDARRAFTAVEEARRLADEILKSPFDEILCVVLMLEIGKGVLPQENLETLVTALGDDLLSLRRVTSPVEASMVLILAQIALQLGDRRRFECLSELAESAPGEALARDRWRVDYLKSWAAFERGDLPRAHAYLQESWRNLLAILDSENVAELPLTYLEDRDSLQSFTSSLGPRLVESGQTTSTYLCLAAELQNSLMQDLSLIVDKETRSKFLSRPLTHDWLEEDINFLVDTGPPSRPTAFLQFLSDGSGYRPLLSLKQPGRPLNVRLEGRLDGHALNEAWAELRFAVATYNPAVGADPLADLPNWTAVAEWLALAVRDNVPPGAHLCVVPTQDFSHLPLHLARCSVDGRPLITDYSFSYVPSLFVAARLRERRLADRRGSGWRPARVGSFVVWLTDDDEDVVGSFTAHSRRTLDFLRGQGADVVFAEGTTATRGFFGDVLQDTQLLHVCCHGMTSLRARMHRLLVSDGKSLPPSDLTALANSRNDAFFLDWDKIGARRAPAIVLSCACSSGMASLHAAGERIGFERPLFQRGTCSFIAPLWDIAVFDIHSLTEGVLHNYYSSPHVDLGQAVQKTILDALARDRMAHCAGALALMGDWL